MHLVAAAGAVEEPTALGRLLDSPGPSSEKVLKFFGEPAYIPA
jgi:hypothetical protein